MTVQQFKEWLIKHQIPDDATLDTVTATWSPDPPRRVPGGVIMYQRTTSDEEPPEIVLGKL